MGFCFGTGGLVKAYTTALQEALNKASVVQKELGKEVQIMVDYADLEKLKYYLRQNKIQIADVNYKENVALLVEMTQEKWAEMLSQRENLNFKMLDCQIIKNKFIVV